MCRGSVFVYGVAALLALTQTGCRELIFPRTHLTATQVKRLAEITESRIVAVPVGTETIRGLVKPPKDPNAPWLVFFGGNGYSLADSAGAVTTLKGENDIGYAIFAYRGYDTSSGDPSEAALKGDARAIYAMLAADYGVSHERLFVAGMSVGTGVAASLAGDLSRQKTPPAGLILLAAYRSLKKVATGVFPGAGGLIADNFDIETQLPDLKLPVLLLHGNQDNVIPLDHSKYIARKLGARAELIVLPGKGHNDLFSTIFTVKQPPKRVIITDITVPNHVLGFLARQGFRTQPYADDHFKKDAPNLPEYLESQIDQTCAAQRRMGHYCTGGVMSGGQVSFERGSDGKYRAMMSVPVGTLAARGHMILADNHEIEQLDGSVALTIGTVGTFDGFSSNLPVRAQYHRSVTTGGRGLNLYAGGTGEIEATVSFDKLFGENRQFSPTGAMISVGPEAGVVYRTDQMLTSVGLFVRGAAKAVEHDPDYLALTGGAQLRFAWNDAIFVRLEAERTVATTADAAAYQMARLYADYKNCSLFENCIMVGLDMHVRKAIEGGGSALDTYRIFVPAEYGDRDTKPEFYIGISGGLSY